MHLLLKAKYIYKFLRSLGLELKIILIVLAVIILMPIMAVLTAANVGITAISSALAVVNTVTHLVDIIAPDGNVVAQIEVSTAWPVHGQVTTEFGEMTPYQKFHSGIDIASHRGDAITPFMAGKVITANRSSQSGYGKYVEVEHGHHVTSLYAHLDEVEVKVGQEVKPGDVLGLEGATGHVVGIPGDHLHFEIKVYGFPVNPRTFMVGEPPR